jgi:shikimate kinase
VSPALPPFAPPRTIVLVGLMGAGKSAIGRRLAQKLHLPFIDADQEIERAAGCSIEEFFAKHGEAAFREGERRVMSRLLDQPAHVLATGGGAFIDEATRSLVRQRAISVWLRAELPLLLERVQRRSNRPLLKQGDPRQVLEQLMQKRYPIYAEADITVDSRDNPAEQTTQDVIDALQRFLAPTQPISAAS